MSDSELISVNWQDNSATASTTVGSVGATVINSPRGGDKPIKFKKGQTSRILDFYGIPDTNNVAVAELIQFNNSYPIWVSAPSVGGTYAGVLVTKTGTKALISGLSDISSDNFNFSTIPAKEAVSQTADGTITNFTLTVSDYAHYVAQSIDITVNGTSIGIVASSATPEVLTSASGSGTFTVGTGALDFTFTTAPIAGSIIKATYSVNYLSDAYFALFDRNPQVSDLKVKCTLADATTGEFTIYLYKESRTSVGTYKLLSNWPITLSTVENTKNGYQENIFMNDYLEDDDYAVAIANTGLTVSTFTADTNPVLMTGGTRGTTSATELATGWSYFEKANKYPADIFFDTTADTSIPAIFNTLSSSYQLYSSYIYPMANTSVATAITGSSSIMTDNKNIAFYWGWGKIYNSYTDSYLASPLTGRVALRYAEMHDVYNGLSPAWYNENGTHGGQLGSGISEMFYEADDTEQANLEDVRINPIIKHPTFGVMISRERTSQSEKSDYSSIGHTRLANYMVSNALTVLPYQLFKLNDASHRASVKSQIDSILSPLATAPYNLLRDYIVKCDESNNGDAVLQAEKFVVTIAFRFTPFSHYIIFNVINSAQGTTAEEAVSS
jgi:hypothetical protein